MTPSIWPNRSSSVCALIVTALVCGSCSTNRTSLSHSWVDRTHEQKLYEKVLVIALVTNADTRRIFETQLSGILESNGIAAVPSFTVMPEPGTADDKEAVRENVRAGIAKSGADAVTITHLVDTKIAERWIEGTPEAIPHTNYGSYYGYGYAYQTYEVVGNPARRVEDKTYVLETKFYDAASEKLVWAGTSETVNPKAAVEGIDSVGRLIVSTLKKEGLLGK